MNKVFGTSNFHVIKMDTILILICQISIMNKVYFLICQIFMPWRWIRSILPCQVLILICQISFLKMNKIWFSCVHYFNFPMSNFHVIKMNNILILMTQISMFIKMNKILIFMSNFHVIKMNMILIIICQISMLHRWKMY